MTLLATPRGEWESFEQTQTQILTGPKPTTTSIQPTKPSIQAHSAAPTKQIPKQIPKPTPTLTPTIIPTVPPISAISGNTHPSTTSPSSTSKPAYPITPLAPLSQPTSSGNLFAGLETKKPTTPTPSADPFASLSDLQDIMKARPMITPTPPPSQKSTTTTPIKPSPAKQAPLASNFSLAGLQTNNTPSTPNIPSSSELFATQLNNGGDPFGDI
jgi:hypothetical protein